MINKKIVHEIINSNDIDLASESIADYEKIDFSDTENTLLALAGIYIELINEQIEIKDVASSGRLQGNIKPTELQINGNVLSIGITAPSYASYQDEGVNGWAIDRGSRFKFKTRGVDPNGEMVKSVKEWVAREGSSARNVSRPVSSREAKGKRMIDASTRAAVTASYFIKKKGIEPTRFWQDATNEFIPIMEKELGIAVKIDIINNLVP
jgi:hypothetical protein